MGYGSEATATKVLYVSYYTVTTVCLATYMRLGFYTVYFTLIVYQTVQSLGEVTSSSSSSSDTVALRGKTKSQKTRNLEKTWLPSYAGRFRHSHYLQCVASY